MLMSNKPNFFSNLSNFLWLSPLVFALFFTIFGLFKMSWPSTLPWHDKSSLLRFLGFETLIFFIVIAKSRLTKKNIFVIGAAVCASLVIFAGALWPLIISLYFILSSYILGRTACFFLTKTSANSNFLINFLVGTGLYASLVSVLAHFSINYPGVYFFLLLIPFLIDSKITIGIAKSIWVLLKKEKPQNASINWLDIALVVVAAAYISVALLPEVDYDSLVTHLFVPSQLYYHHLWEFDISLYAFAVMPMQADWIYSINYMLGGETAARFINIFFIFSLALLVRDFVNFLKGTEYLGKLAALILLTTPLAFLEGTSLHIEGIWSAFLVGSFLAFFKFITLKNQRNFHFINASLLLGFALATKAITLLMLPAFGFLLLLNILNTSMRAVNLKTIFFGIFGFLIFGGVPYFVAWCLTNNPVFPYFNDIFHSPFFSIERFKDMRWQSGFRLDLLYDITFYSNRYQEAQPGAPGFQWMLIFSPSIFYLIRDKSYKSLMLIFLGIFSIFLIFKYVGAYLRYIFPILILMIPAIMIGYKKIYMNSIRFGKFVFLTNIYCTLLLNFIFLSAASFYGDFQLYPIFDSKVRDEYIINRLPERAAVDLVNRLNTLDTPVAFISSPFGAGLKADALYAAWYNQKFFDDLININSDKDALNLFMDRSVNYVIFDKNWEDPKYQAQRTHIENVTTEIKKFNNISVRQLFSNPYFDEEILKNVNFTSKEGWDFSLGAIFDPLTKSVLVNESSPVTQKVQVMAGRQYRNIVLSKCVLHPATGRQQVNWYDSKDNFIKADIITFDCSLDWEERMMTVVAPKAAKTAVVYASGHSSELVAFKHNSLLK